MATPDFNMLASQILGDINTQIYAIIADPDIDSNVKNDLTSKRNELESMIKSFQDANQKSIEDFIKKLQDKAKVMKQKIDNMRFR